MEPREVKPSAPHPSPRGDRTRALRCGARGWARVRKSGRERVDEALRRQGAQSTLNPGARTNQIWDKKTTGPPRGHAKCRGQWDRRERTAKLLFATVGSKFRAPAKLPAELDVLWVYVRSKTNNCVRLIDCLHRRALHPILHVQRRRALSRERGSLNKRQCSRSEKMQRSQRQLETVPCAST